MKCSVTLIAALLLATATPAHAANSCSARATQSWATSPTQKLAVEAIADGPTCAQAFVTIAFRNGKGDLLWFESSRVTDIMVLTQPPAQNAKAMAALLKQWITHDNHLQTADKLPPWKDGANAPEAGEFPFYPDEGTTQGDYVKMQKAKLPLFCYVAGMESAACLVFMKDGTIVKVGSQSFPG
jgi:hypothetical protein